MDKRQFYQLDQALKSMRCIVVNNNDMIPLESVRHLLASFCEDIAIGEPIDPYFVVPQDNVDKT